MADIVNLRRARKEKARREREAQAAANRAVHGRSGAEKRASRLEEERARREHAAHLRDDDTPS
ncbi:MAG: DUF4169 family protein [Reyranellaceae bacterium]